MSPLDVGHILWPWTMPFDISDRVEKPYPRNGVANGHETKRCGSIGSPTTHFVTLSYHLELWFPKSILTKPVSQKGDGRLTWNEGSSTLLTLNFDFTHYLNLRIQFQLLVKLYIRIVTVDWHETEGMRVDKMLDPSYVIELGALTFGLFKLILWEKSYPRNWMANWHRTKGMWIHKLLKTVCDLDVGSHPWLWTWIYNVNFSNSHNWGMGGWLTYWEGCESDTVFDASCNMTRATDLERTCLWHWRWFGDNII